MTDVTRHRIEIRSRKLGVLLYDARLTVQQSIEVCAGWAGVSPEQYRRYELGDQSPSLPELETLALHFGISVNHFLGDQILETLSWRGDSEKLENLRLERSKLIGAWLAQARFDQHLSLEALAEVMGVSAETCQQMEEGNCSVSFPQLQQAAERLGLDIAELRPRQGILADWEKENQFRSLYDQLPVELVHFISQPDAVPYLKMGLLLSSLSPEILQSLGNLLNECRKPCDCEWP